MAEEALADDIIKARGEQQIAEEIVKEAKDDRP